LNFDGVVNAQDLGIVLYVYGTTQTLPNAPENVDLQNTGYLEVTLTWTDTRETEDQFITERRTEKAPYYEPGSFQIIATISADTTTYIDRDVNPGKTYTYRLKAVNSEGESAFHPRQVLRQKQTGHPTPRVLFGSDRCD